MSIATTIRSIIEDRKMTQEAVAAELSAMGQEKVDQTKVSAWLRGRVPNLDQLALIEDWAGITRGTILAAAGYLDVTPPTTRDEIAERLSAIEVALVDVVKVLRSMMPPSASAPGTRRRATRPRQSQ